MSKRKYTEEQVNFVKNLVENGSNVTPAARKMCEYFGITFDDTVGRKMRDKMQKLKVTNNTETVEDTDEFKEAQNKKFDKTKNKFIITWAQSETPVHTKFLNNIKAYADKIDASIHVVAGRYKNPTSLSSSKKQQEIEKNRSKSWDEQIIPYLDAARHNVHKHLCILSDVKVQPTASTPLSGMNGITGLESCIIGHPRVHLKSLPVLNDYPHKLLVTTGACTVQNYTDTKVGKKSEFHHQLGFVVVELDGDIFHIRQVTADEKGDFYDLWYKVSKGEVCNYSERIPALIFGDIHITQEDKAAIETSFQMVDMFKPLKIVLHDVFDGSSISHHEKNNPFLLLSREEDGSNSLKKEIKQLLTFFDNYNDFNYVVVRSNHDDFFDRWLKGEDWRKENNKKLYLKYSNILAKGKAPKGIIPYILEKTFDNITALGLDDSYRIKNIELGIHGHIGASGSRGSVIQFKNLNTKTVTGHSHTPSREDGALVVGTLTKLRIGYNSGASPWMHSNVIIYPNGKTSHLNIIKGKFTTLK